MCKDVLAFTFIHFQYKGPIVEEDRIELTHRQIEQCGDGTRRSMGKPAMGNRNRKFNMAHAFAAYGTLDQCDSTFFTDAALSTLACIFSAGTSPVPGRAKNTLTKQAISFRPVCAEIDRVRFGDLAIAPGANVLRRGKANA